MSECGEAAPTRLETDIPILLVLVDLARYPLLCISSSGILHLLDGVYPHWDY